MEQLLNKDRAVSKIKTGSLIIAAICAAAALIDFIVVFTTLALNHGEAAEGQLTKFSLMRIEITFVFSAVIMCCAAGIFFGISKTGKPFTQGTVRSVRFIGILFIINSVLPSVVSCIVSNMDLKTAAMMSFNANTLGAIIEGVLFIFFGQIVHYGTLLQQESDETL